MCVRVYIDEIVSVFACSACSLPVCQAKRLSRIVYHILCSSIAFSTVAPHFNGVGVATGSVVGEHAGCIHMLLLLASVRLMLFWRVCVEVCMYVCVFARASEYHRTRSPRRVRMGSQ